MPAEPIDSLSAVPKYAQLRQMLLELVESELQPGRPIPSERALAERTGVARMTVRQAVDRLVSEGRLFRVQGKGTFVAEPKIEMQMALTSFTDDMIRRGLTPGARTLEAAEVPASTAVAGPLAVAPGTPVYRLVRLRLADDVPMAVERTHLPAALVPGLLDVDLDRGSLYDVLASRYGLRLDAATQTIEAGVAEDDSAELLNVPVGAPLLLFRRLSSVAGRPAELVWSTYRGDRYSVRGALAVP